MTNGALIALAKKLGGGGGSSVTVEPLSVTANDTYTAPSGKAYSPVVVDVPDTPAVVNRLEVTRNGNYDAPAGTDGFNPVVVNVPTGGGGSGSLSDQVRFFDYDGTLVDSYSKEDFNALTAMPANPSHSGLTAQGWNWSLSEAKAQLTAAPDGVLNIGQMYTTDDGKTRLYIHIDDDTPSNRLTFYLRFTSSVANNVSLDWGDGTVETKGSISATNYSHTYATGGDYVIKLKVNSGTIRFEGSSSSSGSVIYGSRANTNYHNKGRIRKIEIGNNVTSIDIYTFYQCYSLASITLPSSITAIGDYAFSGCYALTSLTIPSSITSVANYAFGGCYSLVSIMIPNNVTNIGTSAFVNCQSLTSVTIPNGITSINESTFSQCYSIASITLPSSITAISKSAFYNCTALISIAMPSGVTSIGINAFYGCLSLSSIIIQNGVMVIDSSEFYQCYSLTSLTIPSSVTSISAQAFQNCYGIGEYHFKPTTPPTLSATSAFTGIQSDCRIYVPYSADHSILNAYKTATNWSTYASKMVEEAS